MNEFKFYVNLSCHHGEFGQQRVVIGDLIFERQKIVICNATLDN